MDNTATTRELLQFYYSNFAQKKGWETVIADDFIYAGGDMAQATMPMQGKAAYIQVIQRFSRAFESMKVKQMTVEGEHACVIGNYDFCFPNGNRMNGDVAEIWTAKNGKLTSLRIFFDTLTFDRNTTR